MKKNFVLVFAVALSACAIAFGQNQAANPPAAPPAAPPKATPPAAQPKAATPSAPPVRIAVIDIQKAIINTQEGQKAGAELQTKFNPRKAALEKRQNDIQALQDQLRKGGSTMTDVAREKIMRDIDSLGKSLQRDGDDLNSDVEQENGKLMQDLGGKLMTILDQYAAQNGFAVVLDVSNQQSPVFWADSSSVITLDIVKLYDQAHPVAAKPAAASQPRPPASTPKPPTPTPPATKKQ